MKRVKNLNNLNSLNNLNEFYYTKEAINENMRFEALSMLRDTQQAMVGISFLPVIATMKQENPLRKDVLGFQDKLDNLTMEIQQFISKAKNGVEYTSETEPETESETEPETEPNPEKSEKPEIEPEDSSRTKE